MRNRVDQNGTGKLNTPGFHLAVFLWLALLCIGDSAAGFSLLGPYEAWMQQTNDFRMPLDIFGPYPPSSEPGDIGGPMCLSNGYRWNVPVVTYGFDPSFVKFFGSNGVSAVEKAIQVLNELPAASSIFLTNYPDNSAETNAQAQSGALCDLKSTTLSILLEQLGLASPYNSVFVLQSWNPLFANLAGATQPSTNITIVMRNYDPMTYEQSDQINGIQYAWQAWAAFALGINQAHLVPFPIDEASPSLLPSLTVADGDLPAGIFYTGLTADDVGGLAFLYSTNTVRYETVPTGVSGVGPNATNWINGAWRPGVDKVTFIPQLLNSNTGGFLPQTAVYTDTYFTNGIVARQELQRVINQPDFLFCAGDTEPDYPAVIPYARTGTSNWIDNAAGNGSASGAGPGTISPPVRITFTALGKQLAVIGTNLVQDVYDESYYWASFDESSNAPVVFPELQPGQNSLLIRLWFQNSEYSLIPLPTGLKMELNLSGQMGTPVILQTSTNLTDWISFATNQINGSIWTVESQPVNVARFYRTVFQ